MGGATLQRGLTARPKFPSSCAVNPESNVSPFVCLSTSCRLVCRNASSDPNTPSAGPLQSLRSQDTEPYKGCSRSTAPPKSSLARCRRFGRIRLCADMPAPQRNHVQVVSCKECKRCVPISVEPVGSVTVICPVCLERRSYIVSTEVFLGQPSWEVMRTCKGGGDGRQSRR
jgi:hypothetical protein